MPTSGRPATGGSTARAAQLYAGLEKLKAKHAIVGDVRGGRGLMAAVELAADRATKKPVDKRTPIRVQEVAYREGVTLRASGPNIILSPPLIVSADDIDAILAALDAGLGALDHDAAPAADQHRERSLG